LQNVSTTELPSNPGGKPKSKFSALDELDRLTQEQKNLLIAKRHHEHMGTTKVDRKPFQSPGQVHAHDEERYSSDGVSLVLETKRATDNNKKQNKSKAS
jgi:hypothetical protein